MGIMTHRRQIIHGMNQQKIMKNLQTSQRVYEIIGCFIIEHYLNVLLRG